MEFRVRNTRCVLVITYSRYLHTTRSLLVRGAHWAPSARDQARRRAGLALIWRGAAWELPPAHLAGLAPGWARLYGLRYFHHILYATASHPSIPVSLFFSITTFIYIISPLPSPFSSSLFQWYLGNRVLNGGMSAGRTAVKNDVDSTRVAYTDTLHTVAHDRPMLLMQFNQFPSEPAIVLVPGAPKIGGARQKRARCPAEPSPIVEEVECEEGKQDYEEVCHRGIHDEIRVLKSRLRTHVLELMSQIRRGRSMLTRHALCINTSWSLKNSPQNTVLTTKLKLVRGRTTIWPRLTLSEMEGDEKLMFCARYDPRFKCKYSPILVSSSSW